MHRDRLSDELTETIHKFFSGDNEISWSAVENSHDAIERCANRWIKYYTDGGSLLILPCRINGTIYWYAITFGDRNAEETKELLYSFVGPPYTSFNKERAILDPSDHCEFLLNILGNPDGVVFKLKVAEKKFADDCTYALNRMLDVCMTVRQRPKKKVWIAGYILRDYQMAITAKNYIEADNAVRSLREIHALDALNLNFLELKMLAEFDNWQEILRLPLLMDIMNSRHPRSVTRAIIQALYNVHLLDYEIVNDVKGACDRFRDVISPQYHSLFISRRGLTNPEILKSFLIDAVTSQPQKIEVRDEILSILSISENDLAYIKDICQGFIPSNEVIPFASKTSVGTLEQLQQLSTDGKWEKVFETAIAGSIDIETFKYIIESAYEIDTLHVRLKTIEKFKGLSDEVRAKLLESKKMVYLWGEINRSSYAEVGTAVVDITPPEDLIRWLILLRDGTCTIQQIMSFIQTGIDEWAIESFLIRPNNIETFINTFENVTNSQFGRDVIYQTSPYIVTFLQKDEGFPNPNLKLIYLRLLMEICYSDRTGNESSFSVISDLIRAVLEIGCDHREYEEIIDDASTLWENSNAPSVLQPMLDIIDLFAYYPCPINSTEIRNLLVVKVIISSITWMQNGRVKSHVFYMIKQLVNELTLDSLVPEFDTEAKVAHLGKIIGAVIDPLFALSGKLLIYTLTESAGKRVQQILKIRSPKCNVVVSSEKVGTSKLKQLSQNAELAVITTSSAKHAATLFIEKNRIGLPILRPAGKGTSSILDVLTKYIENKN